jgi:hypothetical protein
MSTTIRAGLIVRFVAIFELERYGGRELMEVMDKIMEYKSFGNGKG